MGISDVGPLRLLCTRSCGDAKMAQFMVMDASLLQSGCGLKTAARSWSSPSVFVLAVTMREFCDIANEGGTLEHLLVQNWRPPVSHPVLNKLVFKGDRVTVQKVAKKRATVAQGAGRGQYYSSCLNSTGNLYAMDRLASALKEPYRGVAKKRLRSILQYRGLAVPRLAKPSAAPLLAHIFHVKCGKWVVRVQVRKNFADKALPFHLLTKDVIEKRRLCWQKTLYLLVLVIKKLS